MEGKLHLKWQGNLEPSLHALTVASTPVRVVIPSINNPQLSLKEYSFLAVIDRYDVVASYHKC